MLQDRKLRQRVGSRREAEQNPGDACRRKAAAPDADGEEENTGGRVSRQYLENLGVVHSG